MCVLSNGCAVTVISSCRLGFEWQLCLNQDIPTYKNYMYISCVEKMAGDEQKTNKEEIVYKSNICLI